MNRATAALLIATVTFSPAVARSQSSEPSPAAEALFDEARELMKAGDYAAACVKFEASQRLDPSVGTLLNLGDCLEKKGQTASAWVRFREAASAALQAQQPVRRQIALDRAAALEPRLCRLTIVTGANGDVEGFVVTRLGVVVDRALWNVAVPVDPGVYVLEARATGRRAWKTEIHVNPTADGSGASLKVEVPPLEPMAAPPDTTSAWRPRRTTALVVAGSGLIAAGAATFLALRSRAIYQDARAHCTGDSCTNEAHDLSRSAGRTADLATGAYVLGGALIATGVVLWITAPAEKTTGVSTRRAVASIVAVPEVGARRAGFALFLRGEF